MSTFVTKAACRGKRPGRLRSLRSYGRPALVSKLVKERAIARFIVAPAGYGKTSLVLEYAETIFSFKGVFWINATSPCFIRDLDQKTILEDCLSGRDEAAMVVFEDVPALDEDRCALFSEVIDGLLKSGCEVIATMTPCADAYSALQRDRLVLTAADLLLSDAELDIARNLDERNSIPSEEVPFARRVPGLTWSADADAQRHFLDASFSEEMPADMKLAMCSFIVLGSGPLDATPYVSALDSDALVFLADNYPHLGIDLSALSFEAVLFDIGRIDRCIKNQLPSLVDLAGVSNRNDIVRVWGDALLGKENAVRACEVMHHLCVPAGDAAWVAAHARELLRYGAYLSGLELLCAMRVTDAEHKAKLALLECICRMRLGDAQGGIRCVKRYAFDSGARPEDRLVALCLVSRWSNDCIGERAFADMVKLLSNASESVKATDQYALAYAGAAATMGIERYCECWKELAGAKVSDDVLCTLSTWLFELAQMDIEHGEDASRVSAICAPAQRFVRGLLSDPRHASDAFAKRAGIALERAHMNGLDLEGGSLDSQVLYDLRKYEMDCLTQQREYQAQREDSQKRMQVRVETHPDSYLSLRENRPMKLVDKSVPPLTVNLFGRLEVFLGDELIESNYLKHRKVRILLCLLVINEGRDVSRESICRYFWPNSDSMLARKNFYSLWSQLKKTLSLPDGTCPYLVRHQLGCAINERYVNSDISRFNEICRELLFGEVDVDNFAEYYREIDCHYSDDLVPCEALNPLIVQSRNEYRARLVDALVAGTDRIVEAGNPQWGIWFSRTAIAHDPTREDAYVSLMKAQLAAGQRTAALMTFLECRRALRDELGVDPSQETISLYESMLDVAV